MSPLSSAAKSALRRFLDPARGEMKRMRESVIEELDKHGFRIQCELGPLTVGYGQERAYFPVLHHAPLERGYDEEWENWCERARAALLVR